MISLYQTGMVFFFLCGFGCLISAAYLWKKRVREHPRKTKKAKQVHHEETIILQEEWEECIWKSTHRNDTMLL